MRRALTIARYVATANAAVALLTLGACGANTLLLGSLEAEDTETTESGPVDAAPDAMLDAESGFCPLPFDADLTSPSPTMATLGAERCRSCVLGGCCAALSACLTVDSYDASDATPSNCIAFGDCIRSCHPIDAAAPDAAGDATIDGPAPDSGDADPPDAGCEATCNTAFGDGAAYGALVACATQSCDCAF